MRANEDSSCEELTYDELAASYEEVAQKSLELSQRIKESLNNLKAEKIGLLQTISGLEEEIVSMKSELDRVHKDVRMLNSRTDSLDEILQLERLTGDMRGLGFG